jgi:uncharacterized membrane protein YgcG
MNSRKVRYSCFLVCLTVLLGSSYSVPASAATPKNPSGFTATAGARGDVILKWSPVPNAISYSLQGPGIPVDSKTGMPPNVSGTTYTVKGLPAGTHSWVLFAVYSGPSGPYSGDGSNPARTSLTVTGPASAATPKNPPMTASPAVTTAQQAAQPPQKARNPTPPSPKTSQLPSPMKTATGLTPVPAKSGVPAISTWSVLWRDIWRKTVVVYRIGAGPTVMQERACQGNLGLDTLVENYVRAIQLKKYGDAVRWMAQFQDRSLCLDPEGVRGLEFALSAFVHQAITRLPPNEAQTAVQGVFNLGTITFDQIQYTGRSYWLPMVSHHNKKIRALMITYPRNDLGLWVYDFNGGNLVRPGSTDSLDKLMTAMQRFDNFRPGTCNLLDMSQSSFLCQRPGKKGGGGGVGGASSSGSGQSGGMAGGPGSGSSQASTGCIVNAARSSGGRGMLACTEKAMAGLRPSVNDRPTDPGVSIVDKSCALRDETGGDPAVPESEELPPAEWEGIKDPEKTTWEIISDLFMAVFDLTPPVIAELKVAASPEAVANADAFLNMRLDQQRRQELEESSGDVADVWETWKELTTAQKMDYFRNKGGRTVPEDGVRGGGVCGNASNAARRAQALYDCYQGSGPSATGGVSPKPGGIDPTIALTTEPQMSGRATGMMACLSQGGSLVRLSVNDPRCLKAKCVQGEQCSCEGAVAGSQGQVVGGGVGLLDPWTSPYGGNCPDPPCGSAPGGGGTVTPPKPPPVGPQATPSTTPVPATQRTIPVSPPTTLMPATQGTTSTMPQPQKGAISTVSPLQQKGAIGTVSPLQQKGAIGSVPPLP